MAPTSESLTALAADSLAMVQAVRWSEIVSNYATALAVVLGLFAWFRWRVERRDHAAEVLFKLEVMFQEDLIRRGRLLIEEQRQYETVSAELDSASTSGSRRDSTQAKAWVQKEDNRLDCIDALLRFYILLYGLREARQAPNKSLRACYRFWLAHYYHDDRKAFAKYIDEYYPTLSSWLTADRARLFSGGKFIPGGEFVWDKVPTVALWRRISKRL